MVKKKKKRRLGIQIEEWEESKRNNLNEADMLLPIRIEWNDPEGATWSTENQAKFDKSMCSEVDE